MMDTRKPIPSEKAFNPPTGEFVYLYAPPDGFCGCVDCKEQFRTVDAQVMDRICYSEAISKAEANKITTSYAKGINDDLQYLRATIFSHGNTIISRWRKKSLDKRAAAVLDAYPSIYARRWATATITYEHANISWRNARPFHEAQLLPFLSLEVLRDDPLKFLGLLHYRTKYDPQDWVSFDVRQTRPAWHLGGLNTHFAECCVVLHGTHYGKIVPWNTEQAHSLNIAGFPRAKLVLETQYILMKFLRKVVEGLLEGVDRESSSSKWTELSNSNFRKSIGVEAWSTFSSQAFSAPIFNVDRLVEVAQTRLSEAEDHMWLLQTDAGYFQAAIKSQTQGRIFKKTDSEEWNQSMAKEAVDEPLNKIIKWRWVAEEVEHVRLQYVKFRDNIHIGERLPPKFNLALGSLELLLINLLLKSTKRLGAVLPRLVAFQDSYKWTMTAEGYACILNASKTGTMGNMFTNDPLHWALLQLAVDPEDASMFDAAMLFGFLDSWLESPQTPAKDKSRLDAQLLAELADLAALNELLAIVRQHRPVCRPVDIDDARRGNADRPVWRRLAFRPPGTRTPTDLQLYAALEKKLAEAQSHPFPKGKHDAAWLQRADEARGYVASFWQEARALHQMYLEQEAENKDMTDSEKQRELGLLMYDATPEYLSALSSERAAITALKDPEPEYQTPGSGYASSQAPVTSESLRLKEKVKTRPEQGVAKTTNTGSGAGNDAPLTEKQKIPVKKESLRVLTRMFPCTPDEHAAKPLAWKTFVGAMQDAGFAATQSGGSAVVFASDGEGRIVFHRPHPVAKVEQGMLQAWGRRMGKWFGWGRAGFECC